jgi:pimeloyl-ACP methyl ester carboxylesterase
LQQMDLDQLVITTSFGNVFAMSAGSASAPLVLAIHGWSQRNGWHTWESLMAPLGAAGFHVVSVDMPGWGKSVTDEPGPLVGERAETAVLEILDGLDAQTAVLMGKSWGGGVALSVALNKPERVDKLILTAPAFRELDRLPNVSQPVLLAWAQDDPVIPYSNAARYVEALAAVQFETYATGGHSAAPKNASDFAPKAIAFLRRGDGRGRPR